LNGRKFIKWIFTNFPAPICFITGRMGYGKTDFSLLIAEYLLKENALKYVGSNIKIDHPNFEYITNVYKLKRWLQRKGDKLFILDEAGIYVDSRSALSRLNKEIRKIGFLLRKFDGKLIFVTQRSEDIDSTFRHTDIWLATFHKINLKTCKVYANPLDEPITLHNIPPTSIKFNTKDIAFFGFEPTQEDAESFEDKLLTEWLECGNFSKVAKRHNLYPMQVKRIILERVKQLRSMAI